MPPIKPNVFGKKPCHNASGPSVLMIVRKASSVLLYCPVRTWATLDMEKGDFVDGVGVGVDEGLRVATVFFGVVRNCCTCKRVLINAGGYVMRRTPRNKAGPMV